MALVSRTPVSRVILGTMQFGLEESTNDWLGKPRVSDPKTVKEMLDLFNKKGHKDLDTAIMYCNTTTEKILGQVGVGNFSIATKTNPATPALSGETGLKASCIKDHLHRSLENLKLSTVDIFYLHWPDTKTPIIESLQAVNDLHKEGKFKEFGLSNYSSWQVAEIYYLCKMNGWVLPTVYQGMYNAITREIEKELLPCLRTFGIRFYCYNPLAGGLLTGRYSYDEEPADGRFNTKTVWGQNYRKRYWYKEWFDAIDEIKKVIEPHGLSCTESSLLWLKHHSALSGHFGDGVIIGGSTIHHLEESLNSLEKGPLPQDVVEVFEKAWELTKSRCPQYFR